MTETRNHDIVEPLLAAYAQGAFPMADPDNGEIAFYRPALRGVIPLSEGGLKVSRSLRQRVASEKFRITFDNNFGGVIRACANVPRVGQDGSESWISTELITWYEALHEAGHAHSVEAWLDRPERTQLVGGLYGISLRGLFAGESMFSRPDLGGTDASKVCLVHLWNLLRAQGFTLLDCQFYTDHLGSLGCIEIDADEYEQRLNSALQAEATWPQRV